MTSQDYQLIAVTQPEDWADYHDIRRKVLFEGRALLLKFRGIAIGTRLGPLAWRSALS